MKTGKPDGRAKHYAGIRQCLAATLPASSIVVFGCGGFWLTGCTIVAQKERGWITKRLLSRL
ncbi:hypothetical protein HK27_01000 [Acetobacter orientalis]|nr:hypothetical protein HK27_01000 [Acetobacter orientalis]